MGKLKDFFYNKNDIIVALIILAAAAVIIYMRIGDIMQYPEKLAASNATAVQETTTPAESTEAETTTSEAASIKIKKKDDATTVAKRLESKGIIESASDFEQALTEANMTKKIRAGTFKIPAGSTTVDIIEIITTKL